MRVPKSILLLIASCAPLGCQHISLRNHTERQARTLPDLQYDQVLTNVAIFLENPNSLPYFSTASSGSTQNNYVASPMLGPITGAPIIPGTGAKFFGLSSLGGSLGADLGVTEQWNTSSVLNPDILVLMKAIYQKIVGYSSCDPGADKDLQAYFATRPEFLEAMKPGWYGTGCKLDVPSCAVHVQHYHGRYVWVMPEGVDALTRITLALLDLATAATPLIIPDATSDRVAKLTSMATSLSQILQQTGTASPSNHPGFTAVETELDAIMSALAILIGKQDPSVALAAESMTITRRVAVRDKENRVTGFESRPLTVQLTKEFQQKINGYLTGPLASDGRSFRARKEPSLSLPPVGPPFSPGR